MCAHAAYALPLGLHVIMVADKDLDLGRIFKTPPLACVRLLALLKKRVKIFYPYATHSQLEARLAYYL